MNTQQNRPKDKEYNQKQTVTFYNDKMGNISINRTILKARTSNNRASNDMKQELTKLKKEIGEFKPVLEMSGSFCLPYDVAIPPLDIDPREIKIYTQMGLYNNVHSRFTHSS